LKILHFDSSEEGLFHRKFLLYEKSEMKRLVIYFKKKTPSICNTSFRIQSCFGFYRHSNVFFFYACYTIDKLLWHC